MTHDQAIATLHTIIDQHLGAGITGIQQLKGGLLSRAYIATAWKNSSPQFD